MKMILRTVRWVVNFSSSSKSESLDDLLVYVDDLDMDILDAENEEDGFLSCFLNSNSSDESSDVRLL